MRFAALLLLLVVGCADESSQRKETGDLDDSGSGSEDDRDGDGFTDDCDDDNADIYPGAAEFCDGLDNDCNGVVDDGAIDALPWYADNDGDGFGDLDAATEACEAPVGHVANADDCDDTDARFNPGAIETDCEDPADYNCDGSVGYEDADADGFAACAECDDSDAAVNPDADEVCNGVDDDCNTLVDGDDPSLADGTTWYADTDGDGYGGSQFVVEACDAPSGYVANSDDCNDLNPDTYPSAVEICDTEDNDCDSAIDEGVNVTWYADADGDGYGDATAFLEACTSPPGYSANGDDCDDTSAATSPTAYEVCDGIDNNCDGATDEDSALNATTYYADSDGDGYGDATNSTNACSAPTGHVTDGTDCDDTDATTNSAASEACDGVDNDCDGTVDEDATDASTWYADSDTDGYGDGSTAVSACAAPTGHVADGTDCDDTTASIHPGASETCNSIDDNCDGDTDEGVGSTWYADFDSDGYGSPNISQVACSAPAAYVSDATDCNDVDGAIHPGAQEVCDASNTDEDCDGDADDADANVSGTTDYYPDADSDSYGDSSASATAYCDPPGGVVTDNSDCDDTSATVSPGATETWYDGVDGDCSGTSDYDQDGDGEDTLASGGIDRDDLDANCSDTCGNGQAQSTAGVTCGQILSDYSTSSDGTYWIDIDDDGDTSNAFQVHCDMANGGWTYESAGTAFRLSYTGNTQTLTTANTSAEYLFSLYGSAAGTGNNSNGGNGGLAQGSKTFSASTTLYVYVGGQGDAGGVADTGSAHSRTGGFNGGGRGTRGGSGGGGATDVRTGLGDLTSRLIVAGGGGGCGNGSCSNRGGHGGNTTGENGTGGSSIGYGGTQSAGGCSSSGNGAACASLGVGADNIQDNDEGGGGGGYYGGGAGGNSNSAAGGGSSYTGGMDGDESLSRGANSGNGYLDYIFR